MVDIGFLLKYNNKMRNKIREKRENKRAFFTLEDNISAAIQIQQDPQKKIPVTLLSISVGGLSFVTARQKFPGVRKGDRLIISEIQTPEPLGYIGEVEAEVRYILDLEINIRVAFGCEFTKISDSNVAKIKEYVEYRLRKMGLEDKMILL